MKWAFLSFPNSIQPRCTRFLLALPTYVQIFPLFSNYYRAPRNLVRLVRCYFEMHSALTKPCPFVVAFSSPSLCSQPPCLRKRNAADRPITTVARPREPSKKASRPPRKKSENGKRRSTQVGTTRRSTISATKTRPHASACDRTNAGESACNKGAKCRGGGEFLGGKIGAAEVCETAHLKTLKKYTKSDATSAPHTRATARQSLRCGGWRISINTSSQEGAQALYLASIVFEQLNQ